MARWARHGLGALALLLLAPGGLAGAQTGAPSLEGTVRFVPEGRVAVDGRAELFVALRSTGAGWVQVEIGDPAVLLRRRVHLRGGESWRLDLGLRVPTGGALRVRAWPESDPGDVLHMRIAAPPPAPARLAVLPGLARRAPEALVLPREGLPRTRQGYASLTGLVVEEAALARLTPAQARAFEDFVAGCGVVLLAPATPASLALLRDVAGCGGERVRLLPPGMSASAALAAMPPEIRPLPPPPAPPVPTLTAWPGVVLGAYALVVLALLRLLERPAAALVATALGGVGVMLILGTGDPPEIARRAWHEQIGPEQRRITESLTLRGRGVSEIPLAVGEAPLVLGREGRAWFDAGEGAMRGRLRVGLQLDGRAAIALERLGRGVAPLRLARSGAGWRVDNPTTRATPVGLWVSRRGTWPLPALSPGAAWQPPDVTARISDGVFPRGARMAAQLQRILRGDEVALMLPIEASADDDWWVQRGG